MTTKTTEWNKKMTVAEMLPLMTDAEIARNARKGGVAAIKELARRKAPRTIAKIRGTRRDEQPGIFRTQAEILSERYADRIMPDHELGIGV